MNKREAPRAHAPLCASRAHGECTCGEFERQSALAAYRGGGQCDRKSMTRDTLLDLYSDCVSENWPGLSEGRYVLVEFREDKDDGLFWLTAHESIAAASEYRDRQEPEYREEWLIDALWDIETGDEYFEVRAGEFESWEE
jgi:hypothetical protein